MRQVPRSLSSPLQGVSHGNSDHHTSLLESRAMPRGELTDQPGRGVRRVSRPGRSRPAPPPHHHGQCLHALVPRRRGTDAELPISSVSSRSSPISSWSRPCCGDQRSDAPAGPVGQGNSDERAGGDLPANRRRIRSRAAADDEARDREGDPELVEHRGHGRRRHLPFPGRPLRMAARGRRGARSGFRRSGQTRHGRPAHPLSATSSSASTAARTTTSPKGPASPSRTGPPPASGRSSRTACSKSRRPVIRAEGGLLHLAQPGRGPARRPHHGGARRRFLRAEVRSRRGSSGDDRISTPSPASGTACKMTV